MTARARAVPERVAESRLVYWCAENAIWVDLSEGPVCPSIGHCVGENNHRMRKRRFWVCSECQQIYRLKRDWKEHLCYDDDGI